MAPRRWMTTGALLRAARHVEGPGPRAWRRGRRTIGRLDEAMDHVVERVALNVVAPGGWSRSKSSGARSRSQFVVAQRTGPLSRVAPASPTTSARPSPPNGCRTPRAFRGSSKRPNVSSNVYACIAGLFSLNRGALWTCSTRSVHRLFGEIDYAVLLAFSLVQRFLTATSEIF